LNIIINCDRILQVAGFVLVACIFDMVYFDVYIEVRNTMSFNSIEYAIFLPIVFLVYWSIPHRFRWILLLVASYFFYMSWNPKYVVLILGTTIVSYISAILLDRTESASRKKIILFLASLICLGVLFLFKYFNFISESIAYVCGRLAIPLHPVTLQVLLPVGISFYTFQTLSYVIDVYKGKVKAERHFGQYATFISFFPQLVAGPIERPANLLPQIKSPKIFYYPLAMCGAKQILWGLFKKIAIADVVSGYVDKGYNNLPFCTEFDLLFIVLMFSVQIYCDFSGYSDIAIGTAKLFGINLMTNFSSPYLSLSVKEFWSRWHISLSSWFKDYLYIPLGGNRCTRLRNYFNILVTFLISGLWHGANWTFVCWGGIHGVAQVLEKIFGFSPKKESICSKVIHWALVFTFCNIAWVFFRAESLGDAIFIVQNLKFILYAPTSYIGLSKFICLYLLVSISIVFVFDYISLKQDVIALLQRKSNITNLAFLYMLIAFILFGLNNSIGSNQFVYFQF